MRCFRSWLNTCQVELRRRRAEKVVNRLRKYLVEASFLLFVGYLIFAVEGDVAAVSSQPVPIWPANSSRLIGNRVSSASPLRWLKFDVVMCRLQMSLVQILSCECRKLASYVSIPSKSSFDKENKQNCCEWERKFHFSPGYQLMTVPMTQLFDLNSQWISKKSKLTFRIAQFREFFSFWHSIVTRIFGFCRISWRRFSYPHGCIYQTNRWRIFVNGNRDQVGFYNSHADSENCEKSKNFQAIPIRYILCGPENR